MEQTINKFVWKYSARQQLGLVGITLLYFPTLYALLEIPKVLINRVIGGPDNHALFGFELGSETALVFLTLVFLFLYLLNALIKLTINIRKGIIGERLIRRLRYRLMDRLLRFPIQRFRVVSQGELISQINSEAEPLAGYVSEAVTLPLFQGGTMLTVLFFMFMQSVWLGLAAVALIPLQILIVPRMQRQVNALNHERVRSVRQFSEYIGETVSGAQAIRIHGVQRYVLAGFSMQLNRFFNIRLKLYKKKYLIKFITNFINQLTPLLFYLIGGILVLRGHISIGALVAAIAGHKDMIAPWKELLKYYQIQQDAKIKYEQLLQRFDIEDVDQADYFAEVPAAESMALFPLHLRNIITEEDGNKVLNQFNLKLDSGEHVAIVEPDAAKRLHIAEVVLSLRQPNYGSVWLGEQQIKDIPGSIKSRRLAFQPASPPIFNTSAYENILFSIKHKPSSSLTNVDKKEAILSGNSVDSFQQGWQDFDEYQFSHNDELYDWYVRALEATRAHHEVMQKGMFQFLNEGHQSEQAQKIVKTRPRVFDALQQSHVSVQPFDEREWCYGLSIAENLAFGKLVSNGTTPGEVLSTPQVSRILSDNGFDRIIEQIGQQIASMIVRGLASEYTREHTMQTFRLHSDMQAQQIERSARALTKKSISQFSAQDRQFLTLIFLNLVLDDHADIKLPGSVISRIMFIRDEIDSILSNDQRTQLQRFEYGQFHPGLTVLENLLFGLLPVDLDQPSRDELLAVVDRVISQADLARDIMLLTLKNAEAGISGSRLSPSSRQNLPLARVLIKKPELIVFNDGLNAYNESEQFRIKNNIRQLLPNTCILWLTSKLDDTSAFDRVINAA